jgi:hypothetical protein
MTVALHNNLSGMLWKAQLAFENMINLWDLDDDGNNKDDVDGGKMIYQQ